MSEPSYRINTERVDSTYNPWESRVTRLSDGEMVYVGYGRTEGQSLSDATAHIAAQTELENASDGGVYFATEDGEILDAPAPTPESLKAS
jgi:hypothetical protein